MSTLHSGNPPPPPAIYPSSSTCTLIGRSWNLVRLNLKPVVLLMIIPAVLYTGISILFSIPSGLSTLIQAPLTQILVGLFSLGSGLALSVVSWFVAMASYCMISRIFYSAIIAPGPVALSESFHFIRRRWAGLFLLFLGLMLLYGIFIITDLIIGIIGFGAGVGVLMRLTVGMTEHFSSLLFNVFVLLSWGGFIATLLAGLLSFQMMFCLFPLVAVSTMPSNAGLWDETVKSWRLLWHNLPRAILFGVLLLLFCGVLATVLNMPPALWSFIEMRRLEFNPQIDPRLPLHISTVLNVWSSLMSMLVIPVFFGAVTLFWYDCQVRRQGLDLRLWLKRLEAGKSDSASR